MCGAVSGFHSLVSSGTTPKMIEKESHVRPIGYGAMLVEGLVGVTASDRGRRPAERTSTTTSTCPSTKCTGSTRSSLQEMYKEKYPPADPLGETTLDVAHLNLGNGGAEEPWAGSRCGGVPAGR